MDRQQELQQEQQQRPQGHRSKSPASDASRPSRKHRSTSPDSRKGPKKKRRKHERQRRQEAHTDSRSGSSSPQSDVTRALGAKLLQYAALGKRRRVKALLKREPSLVRANDAFCSTALHEACRHGHADVAELLLKRGADAGVQDKAGNTPAHLAGMHGHLDLLVVLLQADRPPDVDAPNTKGISIRALMEAAMDPKPHGSDPPTAGVSGPTRSMAATAATAAAAGNREHGGHGDWQERLQEELSGDEWGAEAWGRPAYQPQPAAFDWEEFENEDDSWADRIWADMQKRKAPEPARAFAAYATHDEHRAVREKRAAEAAANSKRILEEEAAKSGGGWRERMMKQIQDAGGPSRTVSYESAWTAFLALPPTHPIVYRDVPWPVPEASMGDVALLRRTILQGAAGPSDVRLRLRTEMLRWHPDKFGARFRARLVPGDTARILAGVKAVSQQLTAILTGQRGA